jgi:membrane peptidoglycan carboxypeptidase
MYFVSQLPSIDRFSVQYDFQNARIFDSQGHLLFTMADLGKNGGRRQVEPLQARDDVYSACRNGVNRIPLLLQNATIATEDATFYTNPGFDALSILRAAVQNFQSGHIVSGASTITQQVVRAELLSQTQSIDRKAQEIALAYEISKKYSKTQILSFYLNSVPYGNLAIGAEAGAEVYFHQPVCSIDQAQAAFLAGLPRAPSIYDPVRHRAAAMTRYRQVLGLMYKHGYLQSKFEVAAALAEARYWHFSPPSIGMRYPQFVRFVIDQLKAMPAIRNQIFSGLDITTTLDPRLQDLAQRAVTQQIDTLTAQHVTDGALTSLDLRPRHYGWILAMVGSAHYREKAGQINMTISPRQPGSSMKPFNYIWAFQHGVSPGTEVVDSPVQLPDPNDTEHHGWYVPVDYDHQFHGAVTAREALANSLNVPAVKVEYYVTGAQHVAQNAARFGMSSLYKDNPGLACSVCYSVTLGGLARGTRLLEETAAYGVFATGGLKVPPIAIWKIVRRSTGQMLYCSEDCPASVTPASWLLRARKRVLDLAHAYEMTDVLSDNNARCAPQVCEFGLTSPLVLSHPAAAKTGTTNDWTDNWTVGYTPQIVTGVWTGNADHTPMVNVIGITGAAPIWQQYMEGAFGILNLPPEPFIAPPNVVRSAECSVPGTSAVRAIPALGTPDLYVLHDPIPMCRLPDRGPMPISCEKYPQPPPPSFACVYLAGAPIRTARVP